MSPGRSGGVRQGRRALRILGARIGAALILASGGLTRVRFLHEEHEKTALKDHGAAIYALWHGRLWLLASQLRSRKTAVLVSLSEDGEVIASALEGMGLFPVRGSSSRRGREGLQELAQALEGGRSVALTPDGPRGPRHRAQMGAVALAARTGKPILPISSASRSAWVLGSWDSFQVPRPGTRAVVTFGQPLLVPADEDLEPWRRKLEEELTAAEREADREVLK